MDRFSLPALKAAATYNAAADHYEKTPLGFWDRHGRRIVELLDLTPGSRVLDVGCGMGASALPAAAAIGPHGRVTGIDLAEKMLERARSRAAARGLDNVVFEVADMTTIDLPGQSFDAVISVLSLFFVPDMELQIGRLWRWVRPGGQLAVTVWAPRAFEPCATVFGEQVRKVRPEGTLPVRPWERLTDPAGLRRLFHDGGAAEPWIDQVDDQQPIAQPADWWTIAMGSGYRAEIERLTADDRERVREGSMRRLAEMRIDAIGTGVLHAIARRPH